MTRSPSASEIDEAAADWAARIDGGGSQAGLEAWLAAEPRAAGALLRAQAALSLMDRARALPSERPSHRPSRRTLLAAGSGVAAMVVGCVVWRASSTHRFSAGLGEVRHVPLPDGSSVMINTQSAIAADISKEVRRVRVREGEAWFRVAKDAQRPFVVEVGDTRVRAVGTAFSVRRDGSDVTVLVTEGVVEVWREGRADTAIRVAAGSKAFVQSDQPPQAFAAGANVIADTLAWRQGQIVLEGLTLAQAAGEFNRYNQRKLVVPDADLAAEVLVGRFRIDEPEAFAKTAASALEARVETDGELIRLSRDNPPQ